MRLARIVGLVRLRGSTTARRCATVSTMSADVWIVQHVACEGPGRIRAALERAGLSHRSIRVFDGDVVPEELDASAVVIMGGPMGVYDGHEFLGRERALIESALRLERPILGVCLGSQLIASVLGASVRPSGRQEIGWYRVDLLDEAQSDSLFVRCPESFVALHWHGDIFELPRDSVALARSAITDLQAFRYRSNVYGILFHLEADVPHVEGMAHAFHDELEKHEIDRAELLDASHPRAIAPIADAVFDAWVRLLGDASSSPRR